MKAIPYLLGGVLIVPGVLLAYYFWTLSQAIRQGSLLKMLFYLLVHAVRMLEWGVWIIAALLVVWLVLAFMPKYRWLGALGMVVLGVLSLVEWFAAGGPPKSLNDLSFPILSVTGVLMNAWLVWDGAPVAAGLR